MDDILSLLNHHLNGPFLRSAHWSNYVFSPDDDELFENVDVVNDLGEAAQSDTA